MIPFADSFGVWLLSTILPAFFGLLAITWVATRFKARYVASFALGIFFWFFLDTIGGSANLGVNEGFGGGAAQATEVILFVLGLLILVWADRNRAIFNHQLAIGKYGLIVPLMMAVAVGIHGLGEGAAFGATAATTTSTSLLDAFGGVNAGIAYVLHKALEPMMIGACYSVYVAKQFRVSSRIKDLGVLSIIFAAPSLIGAATGYFLTYDATYFFALGTGTAIYVALRLAGPTVYPIEGSDGKETIKISLALLIGFVAIYLAALLHA